MWQKIVKRHKMHSCILATTAHKWSFWCAKIVNVYVVFCIKIEIYLIYINICLNFAPRKRIDFQKRTNHNYIKNTNC